MSAPSRHRFFFSFPNDAREPWLQRIAENLHQLFEPIGLAPTAANGAPIHLLKPGRTRLGPSQSISLLTHAALITGLLMLATHPRRDTSLPSPSSGKGNQPEITFLVRHDVTTDRPLAGRKGGGGEEDARPATRGNLAPLSSIQLAPPRKVTSEQHELLVPPTILDLSASALLTPVGKLGLPWMAKDTDSAGPGKKHGYGSGCCGSMGDPEGNGNGWSEQGVYANGVTAPACVYCPNPNYTDEARQKKLQGIVAMQVLVTAEGRAGDVRLSKSLGLGLDERAEQVVRTWRFQPSRDALGRAVPAWVTVEVTFHLY